VAAAPPRSALAAQVAARAAKRPLLSLFTVMADGSTAFFVVRTSDGDESLTLTSDAPLRDCGEWWSRPETVSLRAALHAALKAAPAPVAAYAVNDALVTRILPTPRVALRCAAASDARHLIRQEFVALDLAYLNRADAALLAHTFDARGGDGGVLRVALRTLLTCRQTQGKPAALQMQSETLSVPIALPATTKEDVLASEVAFNGVSLEPQDVRLLPSAQRAALKTCRSAQLLHAAAICIDARWLGGLCLLHSVVEPLLARARDTAGVASYRQLLDALDALPTRPRIAALTPPVSSVRCQMIIRDAEALEAQGQHAAAAELYAEAIPIAQAEGDSTTCFPNVPMLCAFLGIALRQVGDTAGARRAYERGLTMLAAPAAPGVHIMRPDLPAARESMRLYLLRRLVVCAEDDTRVQVPYLQRTFQPVRDMLDLLGVDDYGPVAYDMHDGAHGAFTMELMRTGRRWGIVHDDDDSAEAYAAAAITVGMRFKIAELSRATPGEDLGSLQLVIETEDTFSASSHSPMPLPRLARSCTACGATPEKLLRCGACKQVAYCSKEARFVQPSTLALSCLTRAPRAQCQLAHWSTHKGPCRQMRGSQ